jgi:putative MFS transporter
VLEDPVQFAVVGLGFRAWRFTAVYGYYLWGPTIVARVLSVPVGQAARYFVYVAGGAVVGKILVSLIAPLIGRRDSDVVPAGAAAREAS